jgi:hypothetical protein
MKPIPQLVPSVFPRAVVRATILGDVMKNYGIPDEIIHIAQTGLMAGDFTGMTFTGFSPSGALRERASLSFDSLKENDNMTMNVSDGLSMVEALSRKFAHAVAASINLMRQQRLRIHYTFHFAEHVYVAEACQKYGLPHETAEEDTPAMRMLFRVSPGRDRGITFSHYTAK